MDYSELGADVLEKIVTQHVHTFSQLVAFSGVCKSWRTAALPLRHRRPLSMQLPGLLISQAAAMPLKSPAASRYCGPPHDFVPLTTMQQPSPRRRRRLPHVTLPHFPSRSKVSHIIRESVRLHGGDGIYLDDDSYLGSTVEAKHYVASNDGWILIMQHVLSQISFYLLNPITKSSIPLPPLPFPANPTHILKGAISSSPDQDDDEEEDCHVFLLFRSRPQLAWCNVHAVVKDAVGGWKFSCRDSSIFNKEPYHWFRCRVDMDYFGGKLYVLVDGEYVSVVHGLVTCTLSVRVFPLSPAMSYLSSWRDRSAHEDYGTSYHLANLGGQLLVILSHSSDWYNPSHYHIEFEVYKLVPKGDGNCNNNTNYWAEVTDLDGHAVFLGSHQSFCLDADPLNNNNGVKGNRIYFVFPDFHFRAFTSNEYGNDCGIFNLGDQKVERFHCHADLGGGDNLILKRKARTFWFLPMPWDMIHMRRKDQERTFEQTKTKPAVVDVPKLTKKNRTNYKNHQQHDANKVNRLANRFQALLTDEDED